MVSLAKGNNCDLAESDINHILLAEFLREPLGGFGGDYVSDCYLWLLFFPFSIFVQIRESLKALLPEAFLTAKHRTSVQECE